MLIYLLGTVVYENIFLISIDIIKKFIYIWNINLKKTFQIQVMVEVGSDIGDSGSINILVIYSKNPTWLLSLGKVYTFYDYSIQIRYILINKKIKNHLILELIDIYILR